MDTKARILLLEDNPVAPDIIVHCLYKANIAFSLRRVETREDYLKELKEFTPDLILSDNAPEGFDGVSPLAIAGEACPEVPFILLTSSSEEEEAIEALGSGAADYIVRGRFSRLAPSVKRALAEAKERKARIRAEEALRDCRTILDSMCDSAMDALITVNPERLILLFNPSAEQMFRCPSAEALGQPINRFLPDFFSEVEAQPQNPSGLDGAINRTIGRERFITGIRSDGEEFFIQASTSTVKVMGQNIFIMILRDVTERKHADEKMRQQAQLLDNAPDAIRVQDLDQKILYWNKSAQRIYGWTEEEAIGKNADQLLYKRSDEVVRALEVVKRMGDWSGEHTLITKSGDEIAAESHWTMVHDESRAPKSIMVIDTDVSEKKKLETQFLRAQRMESIGWLAGGIAHDLNNVLQPIMMGLQILRQKCDDENSQNLIDTLEKSTERGANLVKQILSIARGFTVERAVVQLGDIILEVEKILRETLPKSIKVKTYIPEGLWTIFGDSTQLHQVLMNLCVNACDAMPEGGSLSLSAENLLIDENYARMLIDGKVGPHMVVTVSDAGRGIPPEVLHRIFEPFFTTKGLGKGTGLGLSTVYAILKSHGGFINVYSEVGRGTSFKVYLPALGTKEIERIKRRKTELPSGNGEMLLIVDDEASIREITKATLETYGYTVITAIDGIEALALYKQNREKVKAVIVDSMMPVMDGPKTIEELRRINPDIKVIASSGLGERDQFGQAVPNDVQAYLWKPFTAQKLLETLCEVLGREWKQ